jgi:hypothetical protein
MKNANLYFDAMVLCNAAKPADSLDKNAGQMLFSFINKDTVKNKF